MCRRSCGPPDIQSAGERSRTHLLPSALLRSSLSASAPPAVNASPGHPNRTAATPPTIPAAPARASARTAYTRCAALPSAPIPTSALCNAHRRQRACPPESRAPRHRRSESCGDSRCPDHIDQLASGRRSRLRPGTWFGRQSRQLHPTSVLTQAARREAGLPAQTHRLASGSPAASTQGRLSTTHQPAGNPTSGLL